MGIKRKEGLGNVSDLLVDVYAPHLVSRGTERVYVASGVAPLRVTATDAMTSRVAASWALDEGEADVRAKRVAIRTVA